MMVGPADGTRLRWPGGRGPSVARLPCTGPPARPHPLPFRHLWCPPVTGVSLVPCPSYSPWRAPGPGSARCSASLGSSGTRWPWVRRRAVRAVESPVRLCAGCASQPLTVPRGCTGPRLRLRNGSPRMSLRTTAASCATSSPRGRSAGDATWPPFWLPHSLERFALPSPISPWPLWVPPSRSCPYPHRRRHDNAEVRMSGRGWSDRRWACSHRRCRARRCGSTSACGSRVAPRTSLGSRPARARSTSVARSRVTARPRVRSSSSTTSSPRARPSRRPPAPCVPRECATPGSRPSRPPLARPAGERPAHWARARCPRDRVDACHPARRARDLCRCGMAGIRRSGDVRCATDHRRVGGAGCACDR